MECLRQITATEALGVGGIRYGAQDGPDVVATEPRRCYPQMRAGNEDGAEPVLVARGQEAHRRSGCQCDLRLGAVLRAEMHRRRQVDHHPGLEVAVGDLVAHVELARACRDVPIDAANIVARLIGARFARLAAVPGCDALVLAVQLSVEATIDGELERTQQFGNRCRSRPVRPFDRRAGGHTQLRGKASFGFGDTHIVGTVLSTRLRTCSMEMSRASAS